MISPVKYSDIYLYSTSDDESVEFKSYLDANNIKYKNLFYDLDHKNESLGALSTWFLDPAIDIETLVHPVTEVITIKFTKLPILVFEKIFWESPDKSEIYQKRWFARTIEEIPLDFSTIGEKI